MDFRDLQFCLCWRVGKNILKILVQSLLWFCNTHLMENLHTLNSEALVEILSTQTAAYLQMQIEGGSLEEFRKCKLLLRADQKELDQRNKNKPDNTALLSDETLIEGSTHSTAGEKDDR